VQPQQVAAMLLLFFAGKGENGEVGRWLGGAGKDCAL